MRLRYAGGHRRARVPRRVTVLAVLLAATGSALALPHADAAAADPDLGPNVQIFDPSMPGPDGNAI